MQQLPPLPGTAPPGTWKIGTADREEAAGRDAIFAILKRPSAKSVSLLGTGFYLQPGGAFATAAHVALEAQALLATNPDSVGIAHTLPNGRTKFLPILRFFFHDSADIAYGVPRYQFIDNNSGDPLLAKVLSLTSSPPELGSPISTWSYPLHAITGDGTPDLSLHLQPDFYNGVLQQFFAERGPSAKLTPPYYRANIHLYGGSSGGPVFNAAGEVFGVASCSFDGANDLAFVTPSSALLDIQVPVHFTDRTESGRKISLRELAAQGKIVAS